MTKLSDPNHPAWDFGRYLILMVAATCILWANASDFDITEGRSLAALAGSMSVLAGAERYIRKIASGENDGE